MDDPTWNDIDRFWQTVTKSDGCWTWNLVKDKDGYGHFSFRNGTERIAAHRYSWMLANGLLGEDLVVMHSCDNPACVRPAHLSVGTQADNIADRDRKGRTNRWLNKARAGEKNPRAILTEKDVLEIRKAHLSGMPRKELHARYPVAFQTIDAVIYGKSWKNI